MRKIKLGEVIRVVHGYAFDSSQYTPTGKYRLVTLGNFSEGNNSFDFKDNKANYTNEKIEERFILNEGDLILPLTEQVVGLFGNSAFIPKVNGKYTFVLNQRVGKIEVISKDVDKIFLHYLLATDMVKKQLENRASGTKQRNIAPDNIYDVSVYLPDIEIQNKVGQFLYDIESKIALNKKINDNLHQLARNIYEYHFLNKKNTKLCGLNKKLGDVTTILLGGTPDTTINDYWNGNINWLNSGEVANIPVISSELTITNKGLENSPAKLMPVKTTLVSITGNIRTSYLGINSSANQSVVGILENNTLKLSYLFEVITDLVKKYTIMSGGNCQKHISKGIIEESSVYIPTHDELMNYYKIAEPIFNKTIEISKEIKKFEEIRSSLLPLLLNGQISVE